MSIPDSTGTSSRRTTLIVVGVVAVAAVAAAIWYFTQPEAATVDIGNALAGTSEAPDADNTGDNTGDPTGDPTDASSTSTEGATADPAAPGSEDRAAQGQVWTVSTDVVPYDFEAAEGTFVGFRIDEELSRIGSTTAVARTPAVNGELTLDGTMLTATTFTADVTEMTSDRAQRNGAIQRALDTSSNPEATFELTEPVDIGEVPPVGESVEVDATGDLTVAGTTVSTTIPIQAGLRAEDELVVTGSLEDVALADFGIGAPSAPLVVSVSDAATVEFQLYLTP